MHFLERHLPTDDPTLPVLTWFEAGEGPPVILLSGGPGDSSAYLRPLAELLGEDWHTVLYDPRGTGKSKLLFENPVTLHLERHLDDLERLRLELGLKQLTLLGHSWGATLALHYAVRHPRCVRRAALIGLGPLTAALAQVARANVLRPLGPLERETFARLREERQAALESGDMDTHALLQQRLVTQYLSRSWFYDEAARVRFCADYVREFGFNPRAHLYTWQSAERLDLYAALEGNPVPTLVLYGQQDFEPIQQAYLLERTMKKARAMLVNEAGHVPWLEQPAQVREALRGFLRLEFRV